MVTVVLSPSRGASLYLKHRLLKGRFALSKVVSWQHGTSDSNSAQYSCIHTRMQLHIPKYNP
jgi:hypothetical protein